MTWDRTGWEIWVNKIKKISNIRHLRVITISSRRRRLKLQESGFFSPYFLANVLKILKKWKIEIHSIYIQKNCNSCRCNLFSLYPSITIAKDKKQITLLSAVKATSTNHPEEKETLHLHSASTISIFTHWFTMYK